MKPDSWHPQEGQENNYVSKVQLLSINKPFLLVLDKREIECIMFTESFLLRVWLHQWRKRLLMYLSIDLVNQFWTSERRHHKSGISQNSLYMSDKRWKEIFLVSYIFKYLTMKLPHEIEITVFMW